MITLLGIVPPPEKKWDLDQLQQTLNLEEEVEQTHLLNNGRSSPVENSKSKSFKLMNGRDGTIAFLPLDSKIGGQISHDKPSIGQFLIREQTNYVYKKVETGKMINARYHTVGDRTGRTS